MRLRDKLLAILLAILLLVVIPPRDLLTIWNSITRSQFIRVYYPYFELYRFILVALVLFIILGIFLLKKVIGGHRAFYTLFGISLMLLSYFYSNPLNVMESQLVSIFVIVGIEAAFVIVIRNNQARYRFLALIVPAVGSLFILSMFLVAFFGFAVFAGAILLARKTATISISDLNGKAAVKRAKPAPKETSPSGTSTPGTASQGKSSSSAKQTPERAKADTQPAKTQPGTGKANGQGTKLQVKKKPTTARPSQIPPQASRNSTGNNASGGGGTDTEKLGKLPSNVAWPAQSDYSRAMQNVSFSISPRYGEVKEAKVMPNPHVKLPGIIVYSSGNYGTIFKLENNGSTQALKCFTRSKADLNRRYLGISKVLHSTKGDNLAFVDFKYLPDAVRTFKNPSIYFPALTMQWVEGETLNQYITDHLNDKKTLNKFAADFLLEMQKIRKFGISHGDIAGDNIMVNSEGKLLLVDYDGMYVPELDGMKAAEIGHDHFQHPARDASMYSQRLDNFSILVTYLSILAVSENPKLWDKYNGEDQDCLILRKKDFRDPRNSMIIGDLLKMRGKVKSLTNLLIEALSHGPLWPGTDPANLAKIKK